MATDTFRLRAVEAGQHRGADMERDRQLIARGESPCGCNACDRTIPLGEIMLEWDDGEYWPTFCWRCVARAFGDLWFAQRRQAIRDAEAIAAAGKNR